MRVVLPALTEFVFWGCSEYLEDLVAQLDAPRFDDIWTFLDRLESLRLPQLFLFTARTETLRFSREIINQAITIQLARSNRAHGELELGRPHFSLSASFKGSGTHVAHIAHVLRQIFAMFSNVGHLHIHANGDHPGWQDDFDSAEWLAFLRLFTTVETLHVSGRLAGQVAHALKDVPGEMVREVLPSVQSLLFDDNRRVESPGQFVALRQLYGCPVAIVDLETKRLEPLYADRGRGTLEKAHSARLFV